jgi:uncharacterized membrane protein HdeD (DUF308 family)
VIYPAWDATANLADARVNGGLIANPSQALNVAVSAITALAVIAAIGRDTYAVLAVFGVWAILAGVLQLATGVRRWRQVGAQWAMILSRSIGTVAPTILDVAPYAGFGAFYFLLSAIWLVARAQRSARA